MPNKARKWVVAALEDIAKIMPFPLLGIDSDNSSESMALLSQLWVTSRVVRKGDRPHPWGYSLLGSELVEGGQAEIHTG